MAFMDIVFLFLTTPQTNVASMDYTVIILGGIPFLSVVCYYFPVYGGAFHRPSAECWETDLLTAYTAIHIVFTPLDARLAFSRKLVCKKTRSELRRKSTGVSVCTPAP
ncbi:hypothetical protein AZE42_12003 [Rhizopogon vesiculosus]|uniref:G-protein coupled receptors family 2 profile 2 domain-containing protein n=1 Tax=Rhizopogon vesiculosus TaxID=180088 RepID=A0A1J8PZL4_9AGAM|nr:hypothetical protein AZE42_12003 [Rhizopogon vesiculosus]